MISYLNGILKNKNDTNCTIVVNNIGFLVNIGKTLIEDSKVNSEIELYIKTIVKENDISLYGFLNNEQMILFEHLLTVSGVGPKAAMNIISSMDTELIVSDIISEDITNVSKVKGLGKKTAEKIVFNLKDKFKKEYSATAKISSNDDIDLVIQALMALGFDNKTCTEAANQIYNKDDSVQENIKNILKEIKNI